MMGSLQHASQEQDPVDFRALSLPHKFGPCLMNSMMPSRTPGMPRPPAALLQCPFCALQH